jgi:hypothetical protein
VFFGELKELRELKGVKGAILWESGVGRFGQKAVTLQAI